MITGIIYGEIEEAVKELKVGKACNVDGITAEAHERCTVLWKQDKVLRLREKPLVCVKDKEERLTSIYRRISLVILC